MENKEFTYQGKTLNGILMLVLNIIGFLAGVGLFIFACVSQEGWLANVCGVCGVLLLEGTKRSVYLRESPKMAEEPRIEIVR